MRNDLGAAARVPALVENVAKRARRTSIRNGTAAVETIEHCLSACAGLGIDNLEIEIEGVEVPGLDGSGQGFVEALRESGIVEQPQATRQPLVIRDMIRVAEGDAELVAVPGDSDRLRIVYTLEYREDGPIGRQVYAFDLTPEGYVREIAAARTFLLEEEAQALRRMGLGQHLTYRDVIVFGPNGPIENELRFPDECVRHKILDLIGDLALLGVPVAGTIYARRSGHALNHRLVRALREHQQAQYFAARRDRPVLDIRQIQRILPHRYPFLLIDRIIELEGNRRAVAIKNVTVNEPFFHGHYPGHPIMPGVLILEAMAQVAGILLGQDLEQKGKVAVLMSMDGVKFRRPVYPGDTLTLEVETLRVRPRTGHVRCWARVGPHLAAEATIKFMMVDADPL